MDDPVILGNCDVCDTYGRLFANRKMGPSNQSQASLKLDGRVANVTWMCAECCCEDAEIEDRIRSRHK